MSIICWQPWGRSKSNMKRKYHSNGLTFYNLFSISTNIPFQKCIAPFFFYVITLQIVCCYWKMYIQYFGGGRRRDLVRSGGILRYWFNYNHGMDNLLYYDKECHEITYAFRNFNGATAEVSKWVSNSSQTLLERCIIITFPQIWVLLEAE